MLTDPNEERLRGIFNFESAFNCETNAWIRFALVLLIAGKVPSDDMDQFRNVSPRLVTESIASDSHNARTLACVMHPQGVIRTDH
jgi:hypothetical protein